MSDSRSIFGFFLVCAATMLAVVVGGFVVTNPSGGIVALVPLITTILSLVAIKNPRAGLFCLAALVIWVDEFKRLAVYYGGVNSMTVIQTLAMPFVVILAINVGFLLGIMFGRVKLNKIGILIYIMAAFIAVAIYFTTDADFTSTVQRAVNVTGYLTLIPICYTYLKNFEEWRKFFSFQVIVALPAAAWAFRQYFFGFTDIEWTYARTGLSMTHFTQMFAENPRVFGLFGSASALGCCAIYCAFSWWHAFTQRRLKILWIFVALIYTGALVLSTQRTALLYPILIVPAVFLFRRPSTTLAAYILGFIIFITGVFSSKWLLNEGLENINRAITLNSAWGQRVLTVNTYSDRLRGWERLTRAETYSWFGTVKENYSQASNGVTVGSADYNHDIINKILISFGVIGLLAIAIPSCYIVVKLHRIIFNQSTIELRNNAAFSLALSLPMIALSFIAGDNFSTNPINIQIWTAIAGVFVCRNQSLNLLRLKKLSNAT